MNGAMTANPQTVLVMAGGTGGHIFPALAVARELEERQFSLHWLGARNGMEATLIPQQRIDLSLINVSGLRGKGKLTLVLAPVKILIAVMQALAVVRRVKPVCVLGFGGFASGPGGIAAWLTGTPLIIHEQNAIRGVTNRLLKPLAKRVLSAFPNAFGEGDQIQVTGNPLRKDFLVPVDKKDDTAVTSALKLLVLGGSLGAAALNRVVPEALAQLPESDRPVVRHQCGKNKVDDTLGAYQAHGVQGEILPFVEDMRAAYDWADLVICRAGAMTIAELAAAGKASILVPFPHAVDDHQTANARYLADGGGARLMPEKSLTASSLAEALTGFVRCREELTVMSEKAAQLARPDATRQVADVCEEVIHG